MHTMRRTSSKIERVLKVDTLGNQRRRGDVDRMLYAVSLN
jgi:hypothetical protein